MDPKLEAAIDEIRRGREEGERKEMDNAQRRVHCPDCGAHLKVMSPLFDYDKFRLEFVEHSE